MALMQIVLKRDPATGKQNIWVKLESEPDALPIEQVAKRWIVASRPEDVVEAVRFYTDLGFDHLVLHGPGHDQERFLRTLSEQVLPGLRELVPAA